MKITFSNNFHNSSASIILAKENEKQFLHYGEIRIKNSQYRRLKKSLCGLSDCRCRLFNKINLRGVPYSVLPFITIIDRD